LAGVKKKKTTTHPHQKNTTTPPPPNKHPPPPHPTQNTHTNARDDTQRGGWIISRRRKGREIIKGGEYDTAAKAAAEEINLAVRQQGALEASSRQKGKRRGRGRAAL